MFYRTTKCVMLLFVKTLMTAAILKMSTSKPNFLQLFPFVIYKYS